MCGRKMFVGAALLAALASGCGTIDNVRRPVYPLPNSTNVQVCRVYGGVRGDFSVMTEYPWRTTPSIIDYVVLPLMAVFDLALSTAGDTVTLPYTGGVEVWRWFRPDPPPRQVLIEPPPKPATVPVPVPLPDGADPESQP